MATNPKLLSGRKQIIPIKLSRLYSAKPHMWHSQQEKKPSLDEQIRSVFVSERLKCALMRKTVWQIRHTWHQLRRGKDPFLYLPAFSQEFFSRHGELQSVPNNLTGLQRTSPHHGRLHSPGVLLSKAVADFLEGHSVQPLCVCKIWRKWTVLNQMLLSDSAELE